jgi:hypothetical protein
MKRKRTKRWVEGGPLPRWMRLYALWLTGRGGELSGTKEEYRGRFPTSDERSGRATELAGRPVLPQLVALLEKRKDFKEYFELLQADSTFLAKELVRQRIPKNFEARDRGLDLALRAEDHKSIEHYTRVFVEHGMPKKVEGEQQATRYTINLFGATPEQKKMLLSGITEPEEPDEVEFEVIESEKIDNGEDD